MKLNSTNCFLKRNLNYLISNNIYICSRKQKTLNIAVNCLTYVCMLL